MINRLSLVMIWIGIALGAMLVGASLLQGPRTDEQWRIAAEVRRLMLIHGTIRIAMVVVAVVVVVVVIARLRYRARGVQATHYRVIDGRSYYLED